MDKLSVGNLIFAQTGHIHIPNFRLQNAFHTTTQNTSYMPILRSRLDRQPINLHNKFTGIAKVHKQVSGTKDVTTNVNQYK